MIPDDPASKLIIFQSKEISKKEQPDTFPQQKNVAKRGGKVAGNARKDTEKELGRKFNI